jgi:methylmalonyl-CoA mutase N-terminal domain/subunit
VVLCVPSCQEPPSSLFARIGGGEEEVAPPSFRINDSIRIEQTEKLNKLKAERNNGLVKANIETLEQAAKDGRNVMPHIIEAVENLATLGEIADTFRGVFGEYKS